jgi:hypothetical protein
MQRRLRDLSLSGAATAGVLTHLPGLIYLAALNAIVGDARGMADGVTQVLVYNAIWFSLPVVALVLSVRRAAQVREGLDRTTWWVHEHRRPITVVFFGALGTYLLVAGLVGMAVVPGPRLGAGAPWPRCRHHMHVRLPCSGGPLPWSQPDPVDRRQPLAG